MSLTRAAGDLKQHDTSLAKSRDVASTPLCGCRESKAPCTLHVALAEPNLVVCSMCPGLRPLKRFEDRSEDHSAAGS